MLRISNPAKHLTVLKEAALPTRLLPPRGLEEVVLRRHRAVHVPQMPRLTLEGEQKTSFSR